jgi:MFS family permease
MPARQPMVHEIINDKADLSNALALNSSMVNLARVVGPAMSGLVLQKLGAGICFSLNALSFVAVIISLLLMKMPPYVPRPTKQNARSDLKEGLVYLKNTPSIGMILLMLTFISLLFYLTTPFCQFLQSSFLRGMRSLLDTSIALLA